MNDRCCTPAFWPGVVYGGQCTGSPGAGGDLVAMKGPEGFSFFS